MVRICQQFNQKHLHTKQFDQLLFCISCLCIARRLLRLTYVKSVEKKKEPNFVFCAGEINQRKTIKNRHTKTFI